MKMPYYICVKPNRRKDICRGNKIWVNCATPDDYVAKKDRSQFLTLTAAEKHVTADYEMVVKETFIPGWR